MNQQAKRIALVEMGGSHDECLYAQIRYLKAEGHFVSLICNSSLKSNVDYFDGLDEIRFIELRPGLKQWIDLWIIRKILIRGKFDCIIFNTAQGNVLKNLLLLPKPKNAERFGVLHNLRKLQNSHSQKVITRNLKAYFVLNDYLIDQVEEEVKKSVILHPLYTVFYPNYPSTNVDKKEGDVWICIPGQVERSRRDYDLLFDSIAKNGVDEHIKFLLLGRCEHTDGDGIYVKQRIAELGVENTFVLWDSFIETDEFYGMLRASDFVLPLIHPKHESYSLYEFQISGSFNLAFGFQKPLLIERSFSNYTDFKDTSLFYAAEELMPLINGLRREQASGFYQNTKWEFENQKRTFLSALGL